MRVPSKFPLVFSPNIWQFWKGQNVFIYHCYVYTESMWLCLNGRCLTKVSLFYIFDQSDDFRGMVEEATQRLYFTNLQIQFADERTEPLSLNGLLPSNCSTRNALPPPQPSYDSALVRFSLFPALLQPSQPNAFRIRKLTLQKVWQLGKWFEVLATHLGLEDRSWF